MDINELMKPLHEYQTKKARFAGSCKASNFINRLNIKAALSYLEHGMTENAVKELHKVIADLDSLLKREEELDAEFTEVMNGN